MKHQKRPVDTTMFTRSCGMNDMFCLLLGEEDKILKKYIKNPKVHLLGELFSLKMNKKNV